MLRKLSVLALILALVDMSRSNEVNLSVKKNQDVLNNREMLNKKLLPNVKQLLKDNSDGSRQKFLRLLDALEIEGYKVADGKWTSVTLREQIIERQMNIFNHDSPPSIFSNLSPYFVFMEHRLLNAVDTFLCI